MRKEYHTQHFHQILQQRLDSVVLDSADNGADMHNIERVYEMLGQIWCKCVHDVHSHVTGKPFRGRVIGSCDVEARQ
jgi:hypothetical protein